MQSRRDVLTTAAAVSLAMAAGPAWTADRRRRSVVDGVQLGVQTYSFHDVPVDGRNNAAALVARMKECGLYSCELFAAQVEPGVFTAALPSPADCPKPEVGCLPGKGGSDRNPFAWVFQRKTGAELQQARAAVRAFRESRPAAYFEGIRRTFNDAGIDIYSYNASFELDCTDDEIDGIFVAAKALGARAINSSIRLPMLKRAVPFAEKHRMIIAPHGHSVVSDPEDFSTRQTFTDVFGLSRWVWANLDIGHYAATGADPLPFIVEFHDRITNLHLKDRKRNSSTLVEDGPNVPWGTGDTPIAAVLRLLRDRHYAIPAFIEIEHQGSTTAVGEVKTAYRFCQDALRA